MPTHDAAPAAADTVSPSSVPAGAWEDAAHAGALRARRRRGAEARAAWLGALRRRGVAVFAGALLLGTGGAAAHQTGGSSSKASRAAAAPAVPGVPVTALQRALGVRADGVIGPQTRRAIRRFQRRNGLVADGVAGPATLRALGLSRRDARRAPARETKALTGTAVLQALAACESGGNPRAISPDGRYRGKYQFSRATWRALGGKGDPAKAPEAEQDRLAAALYAREGLTPWPACGAKLKG